jgi:threonine/homoserine/homoserine lactone efflux protein
MPELTAFAFGATLALTIGPISLLILGIAARDGIASGLRAAVGAGLADLTLALVALLGGAAVSRPLEAMQSQVRIVSALILVGLGLWLGLASRHAVGGEGFAARQLRHPLLQTYALTLSNPLGVLAFVALGVQLPSSGSPAMAIWYAFFLFLGSLPIQLAIACAGGMLGRTAVAGRSIRTLNLISATGILAYGTVALVQVGNP